MNCASSGWFANPSDAILAKLARSMPCWWIIITTDESSHGMLILYVVSGWQEILGAWPIEHHAQTSHGGSNHLLVLNIQQTKSVFIGMSLRVLGAILVRHPQIIIIIVTFDYHHVHNHLMVHPWPSLTIAINGLLAQYWWNHEWISIIRVKTMITMCNHWYSLISTVSYWFTIIIIFSWLDQ